MITAVNAQRTAMLAATAVLLAQVGKPSTRIVNGTEAVPIAYTKKKKAQPPSEKLKATLLIGQRTYRHRYLCSR